MKVKLNDTILELADHTTLQQAMDQANVNSKGIAVAVNGKVVPTSERGTHPLGDGDSIIIIKAFYGG